MNAKRAFSESHWTWQESNGQSQEDQYTASLARRPENASPIGLGPSPQAIAVLQDASTERFATRTPSVGICQL